VTVSIYNSSETPSFRIFSWIKNKNYIKPLPSAEDAPHEKNSFGQSKSYDINSHTEHGRGK